MKVLQACAYGAEYPGNFIASLLELEKKLKSRGIETIYAFVEKARGKEWCEEIQKHAKVYFLPEANARILPITYKIFAKIYKENDIDIVHSHFELYDMPATLTAPRETRIFWHLHDPIVQGKGLHGLLWKIQYGIVGKKAHLLSVSDFYRDLVVKMGFPRNQTDIILNSININRISDCSELKDSHYDFLTFGWDFYRKGDDMIIDACDRLEQEGYSFKLLLNGNESTWVELKKYLNGRTPSYLVQGDPVEDVNTLFSDSKVFIQASRRETFSYAVCEAAYAGLPVISTDISGLEWAHDLPTVFFCDVDSDYLYQSMKLFLDGKIVDGNEIARARKIIEEKYSLDAWAEKILEIYNISEKCK